jgi:nucleolar pre-ribosomal-associated protein 1
MGCIWVKYLEAPQLFELLDHLHHDAQSLPSFPVLEIIQAILQALCEMMSFDQEAEGLLVDRLPRLLSLKSVTNSYLLEQITALAIEASLPIGLDGCPPSFTCTDLVQVIRWSTTRWRRRGYRPIEVDLHALLTQPTFSESTVKIITSQLYQLSAASRKSIAEWLTSDHCSQRSSEHLIPILHAFLDSGSCDGAFASTFGIDFCLPFIHRITSLIVNKGVSFDLRLRAEKCLLHIISFPSSTALDLFVKELKALSNKAISVELLSLGARLGQMVGSKAKDLIGLLADRGMQWCIDRFPDKLDVSEFQKFTRELSKFLLTLYCVSLNSVEIVSLFKMASNLKTHLVETLLSVIIQHRFLDVDALRLAVASLSIAQLKVFFFSRRDIFPNIINFFYHSPSPLIVTSKRRFSTPNSSRFAPAPPLRPRGFETR